MHSTTESPRFVRPTVLRASIGGGVGGLLGALLFGLLIWVNSPDVFADSIPLFYGLESAVITGWILHLLHGTVLGIVFAIIATRPLVFDTITEPVETDILKGLSASSRFGLLGLVYGIAIWTIIPFLGLSILGSLEPINEVGFPGAAIDMIIGHVIFGIIVGVSFSSVVPARTDRLEASATSGNARDF